MRHIARILVGTLVVGIIVTAQVYSAWNFLGDKVDESEIVLFGVGLLGGEFNHGYGHLGMYILGLFFYLDSLFSGAHGGGASLVEYANAALNSGRFYVIARVVFASFLTLAVLILSLTVYKAGRNVFLAMVFFITFSFSSTIVFYANYVRTDTLVAFFTVCALYFSSREEPERFLFPLSFCIAAAIACKISALSLFAYLVSIVGLLYFSKKLSMGRAIILLASCPLLMYALAPYMDYVNSIERVVSSEIKGEAVNLLRDEYYSIGSRLKRILELHINTLGVTVCALASLSFLGLRSPYKSLIIKVWVLIALTIGPYSMGHTIRDYWFIPSYLLVAMAACTTIAWLWSEWEQRFSSLVRFKVVYFAALLLLSGTPIYLVFKSYVSTLQTQLNTNLSNRELSKRWLNEHHVGRTPILLDRHFFWIYPKLYDPSYLGISRHLSRNFTYKRHTNHFLASAFEYGLYRDDSDKSIINSAMNVKLFGLRIDFEGDVDYFGHPFICSYYSKDCDEIQLVGLNDMTIMGSDEERNYVVANGQDPYATYLVNHTYSADGGHYLKMQTDARQVQLFYDTGKGFDQQNQQRFNTKSDKLTIKYIKRLPWVNLIGVAERPAGKVDVGDKVLFVTSPGVHARFKNTYLNSKNIAKVNSAQIFVERYTEITKQEPIRRFSEGSGPIIEVYELPRSLLDH